MWVASRQAVMCGVLLTETATPCAGRIAANHAVWFAALERTLIPPTVATVASRLDHVLIRCREVDSTDLPDGWYG